MKRLVLLAPLTLLTACSNEPGEVAQPATSDSAPPSAAGSEPETGPEPVEVAGRTYRYTSLDNCPVVREEREEMPYTEVLCPGPAGWALRIADSDARQTLSVVAPDERETRIDTSPVSGGAFNSFGGTAEWRGRSAEPFGPDSLVVRFRVAEEPHPAPEVGYLLAIRLIPQPCLLARIAPGPGQNDMAREVADTREACPR